MRIYAKKDHNHHNTGMDAVFNQIILITGNLFIARVDPDVPGGVVGSVKSNFVHSFHSTRFSIYPIVYIFITAILIGSNTCVE